jgi:glutathione S-transferase/GST-like protein
MARQSPGKSFNAMLTLYHWEPNANSGKPILAACEKGVEFASHYIDLLGFDQHSPEYLKINPNGTIPSMVHDGVLVPESTAMMEYIDAAFDGPPLRPVDPFERWRMRWWCRFFDQFLGPSVSMFGWKFFVGPAMAQRDPQELKERIERIPLKERRIAWSKAIYGTFSPQELAESGRRIAFGAAQVEAALAERPWLAGESYSIADMVGFSMMAGLPVMNAEVANDTKAPHLMEWLRKIYARPAVHKALALGRTQMMRRYEHLARKSG